MSLDAPNGPAVDGRGLRFGVVAARFNQKLVDDLLDSTLRTLDQAGVAAEDIETIRVPGSNEVPYATAMLAKSGEFDCIVGLGLVMAGETPHHEVIAEATANAMQRITIDTEVPIINGIIVVNTMEQAVARCSGSIDRGSEFARSGLEMADLKRRLVTRLDQLESNRDLGFDADGTFWDDFPDDADGESWKL